MGKTAPAFLALALLTASQIGCRSCGGSHLDYASPATGCACACEGGCRAGSACGGGSVMTTHPAPIVSGEVIIEESPTPVPMAPML